MADPPLNCRRCRSREVRVTLKTFSTTFYFCEHCGRAWDQDGYWSTPTALRPMWVYVRDRDRLTITVEAPTEL